MGRGEHAYTMGLVCRALEASFGGDAWNAKGSAVVVYFARGFCAVEEQDLRLVGLTV